ncbi:ATP-binding cassette domain protein, partial [Toxoplasma gondii TgCatPRC2]
MSLQSSAEVSGARSRGTENPVDASAKWRKAWCVSCLSDVLAQLCGVNGSGKSTILKLLVGSEQPTKGMVHRNGKLRIGYFTQQHVDQLDLTLNAVQSLQMRYPEAGLKDEAARTYLGQFGISGLLALEPLYILSGGQKSRVAIALMAFNNPHILVRAQTPRLYG